jgi:predicted Rossmann-fold nucleotide-binding protein
MTIASEADAIFFLPGGFGSFEEIMAMLACTQLKIHEKRE